MAATKNKAAVAAEQAATVAPVETSQEQVSQEQASQEQTSLEQPAQETVIVAGAYPGTADLVKKIFSKLPEGVRLEIVELDSDSKLGSLLQVVTEGLAKELDEFIAVPAGCIPCGGVDIDAMRLSTVYVSKQGESKYASGLPLLVNKADALSALEEMESKCGDSASPDTLDEAFAELYIRKYRPRPTVVSFVQGNFVTPVNRANPCENRVIEALVRKKFITSTADGFRAIIPLVENSLQ